MTFIHEAMMSSNYTNNSGPEKEFLVEIRKTFAPDIIELNYSPKKYGIYKKHNHTR